MPETLDSQLLRFHCFTDGQDHKLARAKIIECLEGHRLSYDFPHDAYWNYCCSCDRFSLAEILENSKAAKKPICRNCERTIIRRFLCSKCKMITIETNEVSELKLFTLRATGGPSPTCPGCLHATVESAFQHYCDTASFQYLSARANCPFCGKPIAPSPEMQETIFPELGGFVVPDRAVLPSSAFTGGTSKADDGFHFLEWVSKSSAVSSHLGLVVSVASIVIGLMIFAAPPLFTFGLSRWHEFRNHAPLVEPIECAESVVAGNQLLLTAHANDPDQERLKFAWSIASVSQTGKAGRLETVSESGNEVVFHTDGIYPLGDPVKVIIELVVSDKYEDVRTTPREILVLQRLNHPPVIESLQCNCENSEVRAGGSISLHAFATDEDPDDNTGLIYHWQSSIPRVPITNVDSHRGSAVILNTMGMDPQSSGAPLKVTLTVGDGHGRPEQREITIMILPKQIPGKFGEAPPVQQTNHPPKFERFSVSKNLVEEGESVEFQALVIDPDGNSELFYNWTASAGAIKYNHDTATLDTSGIKASEVEVTLAVSDGSGPPTVLKTSVTVKPRPVKTALPLPSPSSTPGSAKSLLFILRTGPRASGLSVFHIEALSSFEFEPGLEHK